MRTKIWFIFAGVLCALFGGCAEVPVGGIVAWNSSNPVPEHWAVCDGTNGTPNLTGRFLRGSAPNDVGRFFAAPGQSPTSDALRVTVVKHRDVHTGDGFQGEGGQCYQGTVDVSAPPYYTVVYIIRTK